MAALKMDVGNFFSSGLPSLVDLVISTQRPDVWVPLPKPSLLWHQQLSTIKHLAKLENVTHLSSFLLRRKVFLPGDVEPSEPFDPIGDALPNPLGQSYDCSMAPRSSYYRILEKSEYEQGNFQHAGNRIGAPEEGHAAEGMTSFRTDQTSNRLHQKSKLRCQIKCEFVCECLKGPIITSNTDTKSFPTSAAVLANWVLKPSEATHCRLQQGIPQG